MILFIVFYTKYIKLKCFFKNNLGVITFTTHYDKMISSTIKKRTQEVNKQIKEEWCEKWMDYITQHPEYPWDWHAISQNKNLTMDFVERHPKLPWNWSEISQNENITMDFVERHPDLPWNWYGISQNHNLTMDFVERHPEHLWDWFEISQSHNLTMDYVERHPELPWNWTGMSWNCFDKEKIVFVEKKYREHLSAFKIQQWYRKIAENPHHKSGICKRRVNAAYDKYYLTQIE